MSAPFVLGNWKMNHGPGRTREFCEAFLPRAAGITRIEIGIAPPFVSLVAAREAIGASRVALAAQDVAFEDAGAYTGEVSARMLRECGCTHAIIGHSERRTLLGETDSIVRRKVQAATRAGIVPVLCVGETLQERETRRTEDVVTRQLERALDGAGPAPALPFQPAGPLVVAYEPVWAIGSGHPATEREIADSHAVLRRSLERILGAGAGAVRILYGGSVRVENAAAIVALPGVDGCLVGGASLDAHGFADLCERVAAVQRG